MRSGFIVAREGGHALVSDPSSPFCVPSVPPGPTRGIAERGTRTDPPWRLSENFTHGEGGAAFETILPRKMLLFICIYFLAHELL